MDGRDVYKTRKETDGDILALCNDDESWSPREKASAIFDIELNIHKYFVPLPNGKRTSIEVVDDKAKGRYLRTKRDDTEHNNLNDLPDC